LPHLFLGEIHSDLIEALIYLSALDEATFGGVFFYEELAELLALPFGDHPLVDVEVEVQELLRDVRAEEGTADPGGRDNELGGVQAEDFLGETLGVQFFEVAVEELVDDSVALFFGRGVELAIFLT
jgi:hypothetical protein